MFILVHVLDLNLMLTFIRVPKKLVVENILNFLVHLFHQGPVLAYHIPGYHIRDLFVVVKKISTVYVNDTSILWLDNHRKVTEKWVDTGNPAIIEKTVEFLLRKIIMTSEVQHSCSYATFDLDVFRNTGTINLFHFACDETILLSAS